MWTYSWVRSSVQTVASASVAGVQVDVDVDFARGHVDLAAVVAALLFSQMRTPLTSTVTLFES